jgi:NADPH2:quinone reductase
VGTAAVQLAAAAGLSVVATASTEQGRALLLAEGASVAIPHVTAERVEEAREIFGGFDLIVEMAAHENLATDLELVATGGRVVIVGSRGEVKLAPRRIMAQESEVTGFSLLQTIPKVRMEVVAAIEAGLRAKTLRPVVGRRFGLEEAARAHEEVMGAGGRGGKVVLTIPA